MKNNLLKKGKFIVTFCMAMGAMMLITFSCIMFGTIDLPSEVAQGGTFNLTVNILPTTDQKGESLAYLSLMLPTEFTVDMVKPSEVPESGEDVPVGQFVYRFYYNDGTYVDKFYSYSEELTQEVMRNEPEEEGYYWACFISDDMLDGANLKSAVAVIPITVEANASIDTYAIRLGLDEANDGSFTNKGFGKGDELVVIDVVKGGTGISTIEESDIKIISGKGSISINVENSALSKASVSVYNMGGQVVAKKTLIGTYNTISDLSKGAYIVIVEKDSQRTAQKVVVR